MTDVLELRATQESWLMWGSGHFGELPSALLWILNPPLLSGGLRK